MEGNWALDPKVIDTNPGRGAMTFSVRKKYVRINKVKENIVKKPAA